MNSISLKVMIFLWQYGLVDTFTFINFAYERLQQQQLLRRGNITNLPSAFITPITGLSVGFKFIKATQDVNERRVRTATLATYLLTSATQLIGSTPPPLQMELQAL